MKIESDMAPLYPYELELNGKFVDVLFFENVEPIEPEPGESEAEQESASRYRFNMYRIDGLRNRASLAESIEEKFDEWLSMAKDLERKTLADAIRGKRNAMLAETDWTQTMDAPLSENEIEAYRVYRQALRDVPEQEGFPYDNVAWPVLAILGNNYES